MTRNSASAQIKALSMIIAIDGLIPDRRAVSAQNKSAPPPVHPQIDTTAWQPRPAVGLREQQDKTTDPQPALILSVTRMSPAFPIPRRARRQTRLRTLALPPALLLTPANPPFTSTPFAPRKRPHRRLISAFPLQTTGSHPR
jgi:hypothetical protein